MNHNKPLKKDEGMIITKKRKNDAKKYPNEALHVKRFHFTCKKKS